MKPKQLSIRKIKRQKFILKPSIGIIKLPKDFNIDEFEREWYQSMGSLFYSKIHKIKRVKPFIDYFKKPKYN